jgi:hypothetical protein
MFTDAILTSLARKVKLPDVEIFINLGDWPLVQKAADEVFPIFSWCGSTDSWDIVMPTYDITEASLEAMGRCEYLVYGNYLITHSNIINVKVCVLCI